MLKDTERIMNLKATIAELHNSILTLSQGLWDISIELDDMLLEQTTQVPEPEQLINMEHTEMPPIDIPAAKNRGRPRKEATPEPAETPTEPDVPDTLPPLPPAPRPPETAQKSPEKSLMERLLGKDAGEKARLRAEREKELERKLAELSAPKGGAK
jgi:hypothetical protein